MPGIASAATSVVIGHVAGGTRPSASARAASCCRITRRSSSPNSSARWRRSIPAVSIWASAVRPAPTRRTARALRRDLQGSADSFPAGRGRTAGYFAARYQVSAVRAVPGAGLHVPLWLLGSSLFSAQLAAALGLPFAFASHFAPDAYATALRLYRAQFRPSAALDKPYAMVGVNLFAADTDEAARASLPRCNSSSSICDVARRGNCSRPSTGSMQRRWN